MRSTPLVSVILPVYNAEKYIAEAVESVLSQSYTNFELLIINDGSTDTSLSIIESFNDHRIRVINNEVNLKLILTLNFGISQCKGKYIARMDADDVCEVDRFQKQVDFMEANPHYILCGTWATIIDSEGNQTGAIKRIDTNDLLRVNMLFTTPFIHPTVLLRSDALNNEVYSAEALHCEDLEFWLRLSERTKGKFHNLPEYLLRYRIHDTNISVQHLEFQFKHRKEVIKPYLERFMGEVTKANISAHFSLFENHKKGASISLSEVKLWMLKLLKTNSENPNYSQVALEALLFSRWIIICVRTRKFHLLFSSGLRWWNPKVLNSVLRLLRYKS